MPIRRKNVHSHLANRMHGLRHGGRVTLFNYNPSVAGGKIAVKRFHKSHHLGPVMRGGDAWQKKHMATIVGAQGAGLVAPGSHMRSGMGVGGMPGVKDSRKRILEEMNHHFQKRMKH